MKTISYGILAHNEATELNKLLEFLTKKMHQNDEIVVLLDSPTEEVTQVVFKYPNVKLFYRLLDKNFAAQKNYLNSFCTKDYIFNIDADEIPSDFLMENLHEILNSNEDFDLIWVPRINYVTDITPVHIRKWGWILGKDNRINWPDWQGRLIKNNKNIYWVNQVHEQLSGYLSATSLPAKDEYSLIHNKNIDKQEKQNNFYETIK